jgi:glycosyltransferase involved in cell wall biosynthesis
VGEGLEREWCARIARELGLADTVVFTGSVPHEQVPQYVAAMDVATVPYGKLDQFYFSPMKLFEYMAAGRPTVAASLGQIAEVVDHGRDGWLYEPGNAQSLAQGIDTILYNPTLGADMGAAARAKVLANHTWRNVALQVIDLARSLIAAKTGDPRKELQPA